jgi:hypothetical protein
MRSDRLQLDPRLGEAILTLIERAAGRTCHIALIACPMDGPKLGQPSFLTSLQPDEMENLIIQIAGGFALAGKRVIDGEPQ